MKKEKNEISFDDLFSSYMEKKNKDNNQNVTKSLSPSNSSEVNNSKKEIQKEPSVLSKVWGFLNKPLEQMLDKDDNKKTFFNFMEEYSDIYRMFDLDGEIKPNKNKVQRETFKVMGMFLPILLFTSMISIILFLILGVSLFLALFAFIMNDNKKNGVDEEILYRKYQTFFTLLLSIRGNLESKEDLSKFLLMVAYQKESSLSPEAIVRYSNALWEYIELMKKDHDVLKMSRTDLLELMRSQFGGFLQMRNNQTNFKDWDILINEIFSDEVKNNMDYFKRKELFEK